jgi:hypothetical protein
MPPTATGTGMQPYEALLGQNSSTYRQYSSPQHNAFWDQNPNGTGQDVVNAQMKARTDLINKNQPQPVQSAGQQGFGYQAGFNANRQAVNTGNVMDRLGKEGQYQATGSPTGVQAANDLSRSLSMNDAAQLRRGIEKTNAQQNMEDQVTRSELMQSGLSNQAKIYGDMAQRSVDQVSLAAKLQESMIRNRMAFAQALLS